MKKYTVFFILAIALTACTKPGLTIRSEYFTKKNLASVHVDTPDPRKMSMDFGQRIILSWYLPKETFNAGQTTLTVRIRLQNGEEKTEAFPLTATHGTKIINVFGEDFTVKGGIQSYFASIDVNGKSVASSRHKLWSEKIQ